MKFNNRNGREYELIDENGDYSLLLDLKSYQIVVAWKLNKKNNDWGQGYYYYIENIQDALNFYQKKVKEQNNMRTITLNADELHELLTTGELYLGLASRSIHLFDEGEGLKIEMNYEGDGYKPNKVTIDFEYDENIKFSEDE